jgi:hypothetical protein
MEIKSGRRQGMNSDFEISGAKIEPGGRTIPYNQPYFCHFPIERESFIKVSTPTIS